MFWPFTVWGFLKPIFKPHEYWLSRTRCYNSTYRLRYWNAQIIVENTLVITKGYNSTYRLRYWNRMVYKDLDGQYYGYNSTYRLRYWNSILGDTLSPRRYINTVTTVLTVYGIETLTVIHIGWKLSDQLQQYLPFTVLKLNDKFTII